ncbi:MAG: MFS transporter [Chloroflexota bacterium]
MPRSLSLDFWKFWTGQAISALGDSFSGFALPLLVYKLTGSAVNLAISSAAYMLPYLLFGLFIGAWADRVDRKRLMIVVDLGRAAALASIPLLAITGLASTWMIWWVYAISFTTSTLGIFFDSAEFAVVPSLVKSRDDLVTANGRIEASYSAARIIGPLLAGILIAFMPIYDLIFVDALSFVVSAVSLVLVKASFNTSQERPRTNIRQDVVDGLKYVLKNPILRNISIMMALVNFFGTTVGAQRVLFAESHLHATDSELGLLNASASLGVILLSLLAGTLRKRWSFSMVALGALMCEGIITILLSITPSYWLALPLWAFMSGVGTLFNINTGSLRQAITPNHMLGRVRSIAGVLAWSAIPLGSLLGGYAIEATGSVVLVFFVIGVITIIIPAIFSFTPLGHAEDYMPKKDESENEAPVPTVLDREEEKLEEAGLT